MKKTYLNMTGRSDVTIADFNIIDNLPSTIMDPLNAALAETGPSAYSRIKYEMDKISISGFVLDKKNTPPEVIQRFSLLSDYICSNAYILI